jgi:hypothetical protein
MTDLFGLSISEGALVNILLAARQSFVAASADIRRRTRKGAGRRFMRAPSRAGSKTPGVSCFPARFAPALRRPRGFTLSATARRGSSAKSRSNSATRATI